MTKQQGLEAVKNLVIDFEEKKAGYMSTKYNEEDAKQHFITPFFEALGWDTSSSDHVRMEKSHGTNNSKSGRGRIDYFFQLSPKKKDSAFFVEAKAPHVDTGLEAHVLQAKSYAFSSNGSTPLCVLADFETLQIWYTTKNPSKYKGNFDHDKVFPKKGLLDYTQYEESWDDIWDLLSFQAHESKTYLEKIPSKLLFEKTKQEALNSDFLDFLMQKQTDLISHIKAKNLLVQDEEALNEIAQRILDRIILIRNAEDRGIFDIHQHYLSLQTLSHKDYVNKYKIFVSQIHTTFPQYNEIFNGHLFKEHPLSEDILIEDNFFRTLLDEFYFPKSSYRFDIIEPEILGQIYEQFLSLKTSVSDKRAKTSRDNSKRKAGGVFYTPSYIVNYIVNETCDPFFKNRKMKEIRAIKILDPSCGSGSFLLGAYQYLLDFYTDYYNEFPKEGKKGEDYFVRKGKNILTLKKRGDVLTQHLYGVDIDPQAVEVSMLSLYLKVLEAEAEESQDMFIENMGQGKYLPKLEKNLKQGNSLIDRNDALDFSDIGDKTYPFSWEDKFPPIMMGGGGFDIVIGNPPYVRQEKIDNKELLVSKYNLANNICDLYVYFYDQSYRLLKENGRFGMIVSNKWMRTGYGQRLREFLRNKVSLHCLIDFGGEKIFADATVDVEITIYEKKIPLPDQKFLAGKGFKNTFLMKQSSLSEKTFVLEHENVLALKEKIEKAGKPLKEWDININYGIKTGFNEAFIIDTATKERLCAEDPKSAEVIKPILRGRDIQKYEHTWADLWLINTHNGVRSENIKAVQVKKDYPAIYNHLHQYMPQLKKRTDKGDHWSNLRNCAYLEDFEKEKIVYQEICQEPSFCLDTDQIYMEATTFVLTGEKLRFLLGVLNSSPFTYVFKHFYAGGGLGSTGYRYKKVYLIETPIPVPTPQQEEEIVNLVNKILQAKKDLKQPHLSTPKKEGFQDDIIALEKKIDQLVFNLYNLSQDDVNLVLNG